MEKRRARRHLRRVRVRYGEKGKGFTNTGLTNDVSASGLFVLANASPKPGARLHLELTLPDESQVYFEVVVARQVLVPPELRQVVKSGFGVRFLQASELVAELVPPMREAQKREDPFVLTFTEAATWKTAWEKEYCRGGVFLWCEQAVPVDAIVTLTFELRFLKRTLGFDAKVVHAAAGSDGRHGVALMFCDMTAAVTALGATIFP